MRLSKTAIFNIFLAVHAIVWSAISLLRNLVSIDIMEAIAWGSFMDFGTNKHPPLSGWIAYAYYNLVGHNDFLLYLLGQIFIVIGFIYIFKLAKFFLSEEKAFCSAMILEACSYYTWMVYINTYNCNILMMALCPIITYYFYKALKYEKLSDWVIFGIFCGLSFLGKYQCVFFFLAMFLYLIVCRKEQFKKKGMYIALAAGTAVILPHVLWLIKNDFFSFSYMLERTQSETRNLPEILVKLSRIFYPIKFIADQIISIAGCVGIYLLTAIYNKNIQYTNSEGKSEDKLFLLFMGIFPIILHSLMGVFTGERVPGVWGSIMVSLTGIMLFYFFPIKFNKNGFTFFTALSYCAMAISVITVAIFMQFQTKMFLSFPYQKIMPEINSVWAKETNNAPLKYAGGSNDYIFEFKIYNPKHPQIVLDTFGHSNPWITSEDIKENGVLIFVYKNDDINYFIGQISPYQALKDCPPPETHLYPVKICNKFNKCKVENFYYAIVPPEQKI